MIPAWLIQHLWESTAVAGLIWLLSQLLHQHQARTRYWLWLAASFKFLVPFVLLADFGSWLGSSWPFAKLLPIHTQPRVFVFIEEVTRNVMPGPETIANRPGFAGFLPLLWIAGTLAVLVSFLLRWRRVARLARAGRQIRYGRAFETLQRLQPDSETRLIATSHSLEPGVFGIWRPVMLLPDGIVERLNDAQLEAVMAHELAHIDRRDNLAALLHMLIEAAFWFHPLVWWLGARLLAERERACDEHVLRLGGEPQAYAEGILKVCRFCLEEPLACVAGVTGADLKQRIEAILTRRAALDLNTPVKILLGASALAALFGPLCFGLLTAPAGRAYTGFDTAASARFDSVRIVKRPPVADRRAPMFIHADGQVTAENLSLKMLLAFAYDIGEFQIEGKTDDGRFSIDAISKTVRFKDTTAQAMMRQLLQERLGVRVHSEIRRLPAFDLAVSATGAKIAPAVDNPNDPAFDLAIPFKGAKFDHPARGHQSTIRLDNHELRARSLPISDLAKRLSVALGRVVVDRTGLSGEYDFHVKWGGGTTLASSLEPQLGLQLKEQIQPVTILVIDHADTAQIEYGRKP